MSKQPTSISTEAILESISDGVFTVDKDWRITSFNRAAEEITGIPRVEALGRLCFEVFRANMCEGECVLRKTMETGRPLVNKAAFIVNADKQRVPISVSTALLKDDDGFVIGGAETFRDLSIVEELRKELREQYQVGDIFSRSPSMRQVLDLLLPAAKSDSTILIGGETGTGKELVARALHALSDRRKGPFIAVNCGALPDSLLESELFGYMKGAFTGAVTDKPGRFSLARGGTLFLDEIGEISPAMQVRLLRVLEDRIVEPLGGTKNEAVDVRVLFATHRDLESAVSEKKFRQDLYYRIHVLRIDMPPLRQRKEDIPLLVEHFVNLFNAAQGKSVTGVSPEVMAVLSAYDFPGNVRELRNAVEHAFVLCRKGNIETCHLPKTIVPTAVASRLTVSSDTIRTSMNIVEAEAIRKALSRSKGNRLAAAKELGIHKSSLFRKAKRLGIALPEKDGRYR
jgi:PAS domain S-box-containing protein